MMMGACDFLRMARVLITGGAGFLGSHVVLELRRLGHTEIVPVRHDPQMLGMNTVPCGDLREVGEVSRLIHEHHPDLLMHLAARAGGIGANMAAPGTFFYDNMCMGMNVLEAARVRKVPKVVMVGTICSYPKYCPVPFREESLWEGYPEETNAPYGIAKKALLVMGQAYRQQYGMNVICLLPANLYGPRDHFDLETSHVIPALIRRFETARLQGDAVVTLWGDGSPTREFLYVEDCARGLVAAALAYEGAAPVNLGTGREVALRDLAQLVAQLTGYCGTFNWDPSRPNGQPRRCVDATRAKAQFGWEATTALEDGLRRTIDWYRTVERPMSDPAPTILS
jgi:GDP-L-fucose synthase